MATSSSAKKVARVAAKSGSGSSANKQANWLFPAAIVAIVALGIGAVVYARSENGGGSSNDTPPRAQLSEGSAFDHWHAAFAINVCGKEQAAPNDVQADILGIHTHGDGLIHIHPFATRAAGENATLKRYFDQVGIKVTDDGFELPESMPAINGARTVREGETECGGKAGELVLAHWKDARDAGSKAPDQIFKDDFSGVKLTENLGAYTLAYEVKGDKDIPAPSSSAEIETLGAADGGSTESEAPEPGTDAEVSVPEGSTTEAPAAGGDSATTVPEATATTAADG